MLPAGAITRSWERQLVTRFGMMSECDKRFDVKFMYCGINFHGQNCIVHMQQCEHVPMLLQNKQVKHHSTLIGEC